MEQVKKHYFWILIAVIVIASLGIWFMATSSMETDYNARKSTLDGLFQNLITIIGKHDHPNQVLLDKIDEETKELVDDYMKAWRLLYEQQQKNNQLPDQLLDEFKTTFLSGEDLPKHLREHYRDFIKRHYEKLLNEVLRVRKTSVTGNRRGAARPIRGGFGAAPGAEGDEEEVDTGVIEWATPELYSISAGWPITPSKNDIKEAQEDLWVYEALIKIISDINMDATTFEDAGVQRIVAMEIGGAAIESNSSDDSPIISLASSVKTDTANRQAESGTRSSRDADNVMPRYIDKDGNPIFDPKTVSADNATEYNLMPIHMILVMDPLRIPELLAGCGNSAMPIEVTSVRYEPDAGSDPVDFNALIDWAKTDLNENEMPEFLRPNKQTNKPVRANIPSRRMGNNVEVVTGKTVEIRGVIRIFKKPKYPEGFEPPAPEPTDETAEPDDTTATDDTPAEAGTETTDEVGDTAPATDEDATEPAVEPATTDDTTPATTEPAEPAAPVAPEPATPAAAPAGAGGA